MDPKVDSGKVELSEIIAGRRRIKKRYSSVLLSRNIAVLHCPRSI
jgi:hypothetical protein